MSESGAQPTPTYALLGRKPQRREGHQEEHEEIQKEKTCNPAYDEVKHSSDRGDDRA
jgi:hypothetical protein